MKTMYKIFILLLAVGLTVTACDNNELPQEKAEPAVMTLSLNNVQTRAGDLFAGEDLITKVRIYVFNGNYLDAAKVYTSGTDEFQNPFRIRTTTGPKTVYVVANEPADLETALNGVTTISGLEAIVTSEASGSLTQPLTMTGFESVTVESKPVGEDPTQVKVWLTRLAAKLTLNIKKGDEAEANNIPIVLKGVRLYRAAAKSALIEGKSVTGQTYWHRNYDVMDTPLTTAGTNVWDTPVYLYENPGSAADSTGRATYLVIDALYNNVNARYIAYINDKNSNADHHYSIKRNHHYNLTATINHIGEYDGLLLQCKTLPWELVETQKKFNEDPITYVNNYDFTENGNTTSITNPLTFTFELTQGPEGATWEATLDNGLEFAFDDVTQTYGGIGETKTITIKPLKPFDESITRTTHFYITITNPANGEKQKVELASGVTQILITQVEN